MITIRERKSDTLHCFYQATEIRADNGKVYAKGSNGHWYLIMNYNEESPANILPRQIPNEASKMALTLAQSEANWDGELVKDLVDENFCVMSPEPTYKWALVLDASHCAKMSSFQAGAFIGLRKKDGALEIEERKF